MPNLIPRSTQYAYCTIPTYPSGQIGFLLCAKDAGTTFNEPLRYLFWRMCSL